MARLRESNSGTRDPKNSQNGREEREKERRNEEEEDSVGEQSLYSAPHILP